jgi:hypothetical protein
MSSMKEPLQLGICEFYNPYLHGPCDPHIMNHLLFMWDIPLSEFYDNSYKDFMATYPHPIRRYVGNIRAYDAIVNRPDKYPLLDVVQTITMEPGGECIAIIKTFWIRLVQRRWKRIFAERRARLARLMKPYGLLKRECGIK